MRTIAVATMILLLAVSAHAADSGVYLNAFGETATAYLNDAFLLLGTVADSSVTATISKERAMEISKDVQKRVRIIRGKLKTVSETRISDVDRQLIVLLDNAYTCLDHQAWALIQYLEEKKSPDSAKRFESQRIDCLARVKKIADFYSTLPPSPELPAPLSTR